MHPHRAPMPHVRRDGEAAPIIGKTTVMNTSGVAPNILLAPTQLISARHLEPRQWVIAMQQATQQQALGVTPWFAAFDGTATAPDNSDAGTRNFSAPTFAQGAAALQVSISWGAGGAKFQAQFDYPIAGRVFGLTADQVEISVAQRAANSSFYAAADLVPVVGAFMVEGIVTDPVPLRWMEQPLIINAGANANWSVKNFARKLRLSFQSMPASSAVDVIWLQANNAVVERRTLQVAEGDNVVLDVPPQAALVRIANGTAGALTTQLEWQMGLT